MNATSLEDFVLESGFYSDDTISLFIEAMQHPETKSSKTFLDRLAFDKQLYDNYDVEPYEETDDILKYLPEKY